jgi:putative membrane protein
MHPHGPHGWEEGSSMMLPFLGVTFLIPLLLALAGFYLWRTGRLNLPTLRRSPEDGAKEILAERFARGEMTSEDFLDRAAMLNWTPGSDRLPARLGKR